MPQKHEEREIPQDIRDFAEAHGFRVAGQEEVDALFGELNEGQEEQPSGGFFTPEQEDDLKTIPTIEDIQKVLAVIMHMIMDNEPDNMNHSERFFITAGIQASIAQAIILVAVELRSINVAYQQASKDEK